MEIIKKLQPKIDKAIELIKKAAKEKQVIFVRHHNDCDGYSAALALDDFIYHTVLYSHVKERDTFYHYKRMPCQAPFYTYEDSTKDISFIHNGMIARNKNPLMIVIDNGSSKEDYEGLKRLKTFGFSIIVIDHHPTYDKIDEIVDIHINPHLVEENPIISAGTLCCEIAKQINPNKEEKYNFISCVSAISDHMEGEAYDISFEKIKNNYNYEDLKIIGESIDYEVQQSGFLDPWPFVKELLLNEIGLRKELLKDYSLQIEKKNSRSLKTSLEYADTKIKNNKVITIINIGNTNHKRAYPKMGKSVGLLHRHIEENNDDKECITFGFTDELITIRASDNSSMDVNVLIKELNDKFPCAKIEGGGHAHAGSIRFIIAAKKEVLDYINKKY